MVNGVQLHTKVLIENIFYETFTATSAFIQGLSGKAKVTHITKTNDMYESCLDCCCQTAIFLKFDKVLFCISCVVSRTPRFASICLWYSSLRMSEKIFQFPLERQSKPQLLQKESFRTAANARAAAAATAFNFAYCRGDFQTCAACAVVILDDK